MRFRIGEQAARLVLKPPLPGTPDGDRFSEHRIGLDHIALGVASRSDLEALARVLAGIGAETDGIKLDRAGENAMITFRDPDNVQWELFEQADPRPGRPRSGGGRWTPAGGWDRPARGDPRRPGPGRA